MNASVRFGKARKIALLVAMGWSALLPVIGLTAPMYDVETNTASGGVWRGTETLVGQNGWWSLYLLRLVPLFAAVLVGAVLLLRKVRGAMAVAWLITAALSVGMCWRSPRSGLSCCRCVSPWWWPAWQTDAVRAPRCAWSSASSAAPTEHRLAIGARSPILADTLAGQCSRSAVACCCRAGLPVSAGNPSPLSGWCAPLLWSPCSLFSSTFR